MIMVVLTVSGIIETFFPGGLNDIKFDMVDVMAAITCTEESWYVAIERYWATIGYIYQCFNMMFIYKMVTRRNSIIEWFTFHIQV